MKLPLTVALLLLACTMPLLADVPANSSLPIEEVYSKSLLPLNDIDKGFITPTSKFFDHNKLVGLLSGAPTSKTPLISALHTVPAGFANRPLKEELTTLKLTASNSEQTVLIYVMNGFCPPCDQIVHDIRGQLPSVGWSKARILIVNLARN
jgi:thiol-disulfide isomerase/thioredoxin